MLYQARFTHLAEEPSLRRGDKVLTGDTVGRMGSTGKSTANHVHFDIIQNVITKQVYRLREILTHISNLKEVLKQFHYFLDDGFFGGEPIHITSCFGDPTYLNGGSWEFHPAYDVVPENRHSTEDNYDIIWNRSMAGEVVKVDFDNAYGWFICIVFDA